MLRNYFFKPAIGLMVILFFAFGGFGSDLGDLAYRLSRQADDLAADGYRGLNLRDRGTRSDVEILFIVQQFSAGAGLFQRMIQDNRPLSELRNAYELLRNQSKDFSTYSFRRQRSIEIQRILDDIVKELSLLETQLRMETTGDQQMRSRRDVPEEGTYDSIRRRERLTPTSQVIGPGKVTWKGLVDDEVHIQFVGDRVYVQIVSGQEIQNPEYSFTNPLPNQNTAVTLRKIKGRGTVSIFEQPSRVNSYQAVVRIYDPKASNSPYEFELSWP